MTEMTKPDRCLLIIFGASGDLTKRKLIPSLYHLYAQKQLPDDFAVLGISRSQIADQVYRQRLAEFHGTYDHRTWQQFARHLYYQSADSTEAKGYSVIKSRMAELANKHAVGTNALFYLAMAPHLYEPTITQLGAHGMVTEGKRWFSRDQENPPWQRIVVEKPFGYDASSAAHLNRVVGRVFEEQDIYRIDHYLGKETVQNLLVFRFANTIFEPIWNRQYIDHIQLTAAETVGVEGRGGYYDSPSGGAMRDMIQSHLLQLMTLVAMEPPITMRADDIRVEKTKVLAAARSLDPAMISRLAVRGQYGSGQIESQSVPGYRQEDGTADDSPTDTFAALKVYVDTWRWGGVPFYLRSGKRLAAKLTEIVVTFKPTPHGLFRSESGGHHGPPNQLVINVQPDEGIRLRFEGKVPGLGMQIKSVIMDFDYCQQFQGKPSEAYATLLLDAMRGDQTLYKHREETEHSWRIVQPVLDHWQQEMPRDLPNYTAGSWGPKAADRMLAQTGHRWHVPQESLR